MARVVLAEAATSFLKFLVVPLYAAWATKLGVIDSDVNPLFATAMVVLSIYGLWIIMKSISDVVDRTVSDSGQATNRNVDADNDAEA